MKFGPVSQWKNRNSLAWVLQSKQARFIYSRGIAYTDKFDETFCDDNCVRFLPYTPTVYILEGRQADERDSAPESNLSSSRYGLTLSVTQRP
jgi:hypothetical protein